MRKAIFTIALAITFNMSFASANAEVFQVDEQELNAEFAQLNELEQFVNANEGITISEISQDNPLVQNVTNSSDVLGIVSALRGDPPLGIPSFLWGFCLSGAGVALVYFVADDRDETKKAFIGCAVGTGAYLIFYLIYFFVVLSSV